VSRTLARLIGFECELVAEHMVDGCPPRIMSPIMPRFTAKQMTLDEGPVMPTIRTAVYECEFRIDGDPIMATYRRRE